MPRSSICSLAHCISSPVRSSAKGYSSEFNYLKTILKGKSQYITNTGMVVFLATGGIYPYFYHEKTLLYLKKLKNIGLEETAADS
ncbi:hypothetical protein ES705_46363 [subsurface metagenome]